MASNHAAQEHGHDGLTEISTQSRLVGIEQGELDGAAPESPPPLFGFGRHMCPGRELAKLEHISILQRLLLEFDYQIVEGQVGCWLGYRTSSHQVEIVTAFYGIVREYSSKITRLVF